VTGGWRRLHNEKLRNLYTSPNIIRVIKSRRMRWVGHVARIGDVRNPYTVLSENVKRRDHLEHPGINGKVIRMDLREIGRGVVDCLHLAQDKDQWQALINMVTTNLFSP
jgi:hypothetical protein